MMQNKLKPVLIFVTAVFITIIIISVVALNGLFHKNPFGYNTEIDNFSSYYKNTPKERYEATTAALYTTISSNLNEGDTVPTKGALVRESSIQNKFDKQTSTHIDNFIVDIESIKQSYNIQIIWSTDNNPDVIEGYSVLVLCPSENELIYSNFNCKDMITENPASMLFINHPFLSDFPLEISFYNKDYSNYTHYIISYKTNESFEDLEFTITDYTGGNYERALAKLKEYDITPEKYNVIYNNQSSNQTPTRPPDVVEDF